LNDCYGFTLLKFYITQSDNFGVVETNLLRRWVGSVWTNTCLYSTDKCCLRVWQCCSCGTRVC